MASTCIDVISGHRYALQMSGDRRSSSRCAFIGLAPRQARGGRGLPAATDSHGHLGSRFRAFR
jgi:hypothetical protein